MPAFGIPDVCILGAGTAGLLLARQLSVSGARITIVERGPLTKTVDPSADEVRFEEARYRGALDGRRFGFGGTSSIWGGQLIPMVPEDFANCLEGQREPWPIGFDDLSDDYRNVWLALGLNESQYVETFGRSATELFSLPGFVSRQSFAIVARRRNFAHLWGDELAAAGNVSILSDASAVGFEAEREGTSSIISTVSIQERSGRISKIHARNFVVAAGALESTRLLLELQASQPAMAGKQLGIGLQDHLSVPIARIVVKNGAAFSAAWSPMLRRSGLAFRRLEATAGYQQKLRVPSSFLHITYDSTAAFPSALHRLAQTLQLRDFVQASKTALQLPRYVREIAGMGLASLLRRRIEWPQSTPMTLLLDIEQMPDPRNRLSLDPPITPGERRKLAIRWAIRDADLAAVQTIAGNAIDSWKAYRFSNILDLEPFPFHGFVESLKGDANSLDVFHPIGTTRMSSSAATGVVDRDCRVHGCRNLYVASTSVFPRAGAANPTFTLLALANRLARHLSKQLSE